MQQEYFTENKAIINEGELGTCMYVLADGQLEVRKDHRILKVIKSGEEWVGYIYINIFYPYRFF